ncbi:MAG TPA: Flp family type IVb pilin [Verrucomicrobiae bacterium]|nr:Flp family type IVb pilin [Verrucomicrobiae bacterium]
MIRRFLKDERGATSIEYALIASIILFAIILAIQPIGETLQSVFGEANAGFGS